MRNRTATEARFCTAVQSNGDIDRSFSATDKVFLGCRLAGSSARIAPSQSKEAGK